eukprot:scaffold9761_cov118-Isochrysis_galbana.AAC.8
MEWDLSMFDEAGRPGTPSASYAWQLLGTAVRVGMSDVMWDRGGSSKFGNFAGCEPLQTGIRRLGY